MMKPHNQAASNPRTPMTCILVIRLVKDSVHWRTTILSSLIAGAVSKFPSVLATMRWDGRLATIDIFTTSEL